MTALLILALSGPTREPVDGLATYYDPGLMQQVADNRGMSLDGFAGGVALNDCADLGLVVWLEFEGLPVLGQFLVADCAQPQHAIIREERGRVVEVSADLARRVGFYGVGPWPVRVLWALPMEAVQ